MGVGNSTRLGLAAVLLVAGLVAQPVQQSAAAAPPPCGEEASTQDGAIADAVRCGKPIEDLSARTETDQVFANPDGTFTRSEGLEPQRVRKPDGWHPIDTTLRLDSGGGVVAAAIA